MTMSRPNPPRNNERLLAIGLLLLYFCAMAVLAGCFGAQPREVDLTPDYSALRTLDPDTVHIWRERIRWVPLPLPGQAVTTPETVLVHVPRPDSIPQYPINRLVVDSGSVRLMGSYRDFRFTAPAPGERLTVEAVDSANVKGYVSGKPRPRRVTVYEPSPDREGSALSRWLATAGGKVKWYFTQVLVQLILLIIVLAVIAALAYRYFIKRFNLK